MLAYWGTKLLIAFKPENLPRLSEIGVDTRVLLFALGISLITGLVFGLLPAWAASRSGVSEALKEGGRSSTAGGARQRMRSTFVVVELAIALVLLVGAGLLIKTFWKLRSIEPGFNPDHLMTMRIELPESRYKDVHSQSQFRSQILAGINSLPGVQGAMISELPLSGDSLNHNFIIENRPPIAPGDEPDLETRSVMGDYFKVMQIPLKSGRSFGPQDFDDQSPLTGIANESLVKQYFQNEDPIGKRIRWASDPGNRWMTIVGVVGDVKHFGLDLPELPAFYTPYTQIASWKRWMSVAARTQADPASMSAAIKKEIWKVDSQLPITRQETMNAVAAESFAARRFNMSLLTLFAALALVLAAIGIYGVMSYAVTQRTQEIGIRMALGANGYDVLKLVLRNGLTLVIIGVAIGLGGAIALTRLMVTLLFGVTPTDALTIGVVSGVLIAVALLACFIPARRATKVDPLVALRYE
jgi:putative ABC transport system permease protein